MSTFTPTVTAVIPTANPDKTTGPKGRPQSIDPLANDTAGEENTPLDPSTLTLLNQKNIPVESIKLRKQGTFVVEDGKITFTPLPRFVGQARPVKYQVKDVNGTPAVSTYTAKVKSRT